MSDEPVLACSICGNAIERGGPAIAQPAGEPARWVGFVEELDPVTDGLSHPECFERSRGLSALVAAVQRSDTERRARAAARDQRPRCQLCGEPVELVDPLDPESWVHAEDANDRADHTAQID